MCNVFILHDSQYSATSLALLFADYKSSISHLVQAVVIGLKVCHCLNFSAFKISVFFHTDYFSPLFQIQLCTSNSCAQAGCIVFRTIHLLSRPGGNFSSIFGLLPSSHNFSLAVCGLFSNFLFMHFKKLFPDFNRKVSSHKVVHIACLSSTICFVRQSSLEICLRMCGNAMLPDDIVSPPMLAINIQLLCLTYEQSEFFSVH